MDNFSWGIAEMEIMLRQSLIERLPQVQPVPPGPERSTRIRSVLAALLVRAGLRLDPAAAEGLRALKLSPVSGEGQSER